MHPKGGELFGEQKDNRTVYLMRSFEDPTSEMLEALKLLLSHSYNFLTLAKWKHNWASQEQTMENISILNPKVFTQILSSESLACLRLINYSPNWRPCSWRFPRPWLFVSHTVVRFPHPSRQHHWNAAAGKIPDAKLPWNYCIQSLSKFSIFYLLIIFHVLLS